MSKILVVLPISEEHKKQLIAAAPKAEFVFTNGQEVTRDEVQEAEVIVGAVNPKYIAKSSKLKLLQLQSAGIDMFMGEGILAENTTLANATGAYGQAVAEHMFAMMFAIQKKLTLYRDAQYSGKWEDLGSVTSLSGKTVLIVGLGDIGRYFASLIKPFDTNIIGVKRRVENDNKEVNRIIQTKEIYEVLPEVDVVVSFLPGIPETTNIYNEKFFKTMKKTSIFLNGGRGSAVDQDALLSALRNGEIFGAGLDVTNPEPLPSNHPLWKEEKVFITPHISGQYHLQETLDKIVNIATKNISNLYSGKSFINVMDVKTGLPK
ncbi:MAG: D-2-hydroxyacid dehydrogenase [Suipraeoptans sp.]